MDLAEALEIVVARTKHERYRQLVDPAHPDYARGYEATVMALATGIHVSTNDSFVIEGQSNAIIAQLATCPFWIRVGCGCGENRCAAGAGYRGIVFPPDCANCTIPNNSQNS